MRDSETTPGEMLEQILDVGTGVGILLLPLWLVFVPGIVLLLVLPIVLLLAPVALAGALLAPPLLLVRWIRRRRQAIAGASGRRPRAASMSASLNSGSSRRPARNAS
jgi:hypothetical protein